MDRIPDTKGGFQLLPEFHVVCLLLHRQDGRCIEKNDTRGRAWCLQLEMTMSKGRSAFGKAKPVCGGAITVDPCDSFLAFISE